MTPRPRELLQTPKMVALLVWSIIGYTLTEAETFLLGVFAVLVGLKYGLLEGLIVYVGLYFVMRMVGGYVSMIATKMEWIARAITRSKL